MQQMVPTSTQFPFSSNLRITERNHLEPATLATKRLKEPSTLRRHPNKGFSVSTFRPRSVTLIAVAITALHSALAACVPLITLRVNIIT